MAALAATVLGVMFVGACAWAGWLARERARLLVIRDYASRLESDLMMQRTALAGEERQRAFLESQLDAHRWHRWWVRNAAETTALDEGRPHLLRLAVAAQLAPSLERFRADLHSLAADASRPQPERLAARSFLSELDVADRTGELPWDVWVRDTGKPEHNPDAQREAYACALQSWLALFTRRLDEHEHVPGQPEETPDTTH